MTLKTIFTVLLIAYCQSIFAGEIAFTFDDAPTPDSSAMTGMQRTSKIISQLKHNSVDGAIFFVLGKSINEQSTLRLQQYINAGFDLGNHSYNHDSANKTPSDDFLIDSYRTHLKLKSVTTNIQFYRFPYLHYGDTTEKRNAILNGLKELNYKIGYVTIDNFDWYINSLYLKAVEQNKPIDLENLSRLYVDTLWDAIQFYDQAALKYLGYSPKHVLLLHENDLAALFLDDLIAKIRDENWKIISPQEAYADKRLQASGDNFAFFKQGRVAAMAHAKGIKQELLRHPSENTTYLDQRFKDYNVVGKAP